MVFVVPELFDDGMMMALVAPVGTVTVFAPTERLRTDSALMAVVMLLRLAVYLAIGVIIVMAIISWVNPHSPMYGLINTLARPLLKPVQRVVPPIGMVDLSPLIVLVMLQLLLILPIAWLEQAVVAFR